MCIPSELNGITSKLIERYRMLFGDALKEVVLYGSYARGDFDEDSDIDVAGIVDCPREDLQRSYRELGKLSSELSLAYGITVSPTAIPLSDYLKYGAVLPYYRHIQEEGVKLFA